MATQKKPARAAAKKTTVRKPVMTERQKAQLAAKKAREKAALQKKREAVKLAKKKLADAEKALKAALPKPKREVAKKPNGAIRGLVKAAKEATSKGIEKAIEKVKPQIDHLQPAKTAKRVKAPAVEDRSIKPIEFIDGLCSTQSYLIVSEKRDDKSIRLGVRLVNGMYRLHFYPNMAAHFEDLPEGLTRGLLRESKGYETRWVPKYTMENVLNVLQQRSDTNFLPLDMVTSMVEKRQYESADNVIAAA